jgi:hypothetical protein
MGIVEEVRGLAADGHAAQPVLRIVCLSL